MPYGEPDPSDPNVLVGVEVPADPEAVRETAWVFAEEFARLGLDRRRILGLFQSPFYAAAHAVARVLGEAEVASIIDQCVSAWGPHPDPARAAHAEE